MEPNKSTDQTAQSKKMQKIISLAKRRGFVYPGSEIYGGLANTYDYGPLGVELLRNVQNSWWKFFVTSRKDMHGMDTAILMSPKVWEASGHTKRFNDALIDCKSCKTRTRADHLIEEALPETKVEGRTMDELDNIITSNKIKCPACQAFDWTKPRQFNLLFETSVGILEGSQSTVFLRGEIAQGMFVNFRNVLESMRPRLPFGIAQLGKAFRNEITKGNFTFRTLEFNLAEFEYFIKPEEWKKTFEYWKEEMEKWVFSLGVKKDSVRWRIHTDEERSHYSTRTEDLEFSYPFGVKEMFGLAYRTDFDLKNHMEHSGVDLRYTDPDDNTNKFIPHVVEPTFGISRVLLAVLCDAFTEEEKTGVEGESKEVRTLLKLDPLIAPYLLAVFPLVANKEDISKKALEVYEALSKEFRVIYDGRGNIGKRYLSQDEIGTPYCVTIDYQTLEDGTVTIRDRDTTNQERIKTSDLISYFKKY